MRRDATVHREKTRERERERRGREERTVSRRRYLDVERNRIMSSVDLATSGLQLRLRRRSQKRRHTQRARRCIFAVLSTLDNKAETKSLSTPQ